MDKRVLGCGLLALAFFAYVVGFLEFSLPLLAVSSVVAGGGMVLAIWMPRAGYGIVTAMALFWAIDFPLVGISVASSVAAAALFVGFALLTFAVHSARPRLGLAGIVLAALANTWYILDNSILNWAPGFGIGNWVFLAGCVFLGLAAMAGPADEPLPISPSPAPAAATRPKARQPAKKAKKASAAK